MFCFFLKVVDRQSYTFLLPQEMPGTHSMLNQFDSKDLLVYLWLSFTSLIQMISHSNYWPRKSQYLRIWSNRSGLDFHYNPETSYKSTLYYRGGSLKDRTEMSERSLPMFTQTLCENIPPCSFFFPFKHIDIQRNEHYFH